MSPKSKDELARDHLDTARADLDGGDVKGAVNALFYAAEAALVFIADAHGIATEQSHPKKAAAAEKLHKSGVLAQNYRTLLRNLNQARKDVWYEGDETDLDLEDTYADVESLVEAAEAEAGA